jgi:hypothetical protein
MVLSQLQAAKRRESAAVRRLLAMSAIPKTPEVLGIIDDTIGRILVTGKPAGILTPTSKWRRNSRSELSAPKGLLVIRITS